MCVCPTYPEGVDADAHRAVYGPWCRYDRNLQVFFVEWYWTCQCLNMAQGLEKIYSWGLVL